MSYDQDIERSYHPENYENPEEFIALMEEAEGLYPELTEKELVEVVENFLLARDANQKEGI